MTDRRVLDTNTYVCSISRTVDEPSGGKIPTSGGCVQNGVPQSSMYESGWAVFQRDRRESSRKRWLMYDIVLMQNE